MGDCPAQADYEYSYQHCADGLICVLAQDVAAVVINSLVNAGSVQAVSKGERPPCIVLHTTSHHYFFLCLLHVVSSDMLQLYVGPARICCHL